MKQRIVFRRANMEDAEVLYQWKNDPDTIAHSLTKRGVTMEEHVSWLEQVVENRGPHLFILEVDNVPTGQLRLDPQESEAKISYSVAKEFRGKGWGKVLLTEAEELGKLFGFSTLTAEVVAGNPASQKLFLSLGFEEEKKEELYIYKKQCGTQ